VLFVGATSQVGRRAVPRLLEQGWRVRALTREPARAEELRRRGAEIVQGDLREADSIRRACEGTRSVVGCSHAALGGRDNDSRRVDDEGNRLLVEAAVEAGAEHLVYVSASGAGSEHPIDFFRYKARAEEHVRSSGLSYTILRPTAFMETWAAILGEQLVKQGRVVLFGRGDNPINYVSARDVARVVVAAQGDSRLGGESLEFGGPENLTQEQVLRRFEQAHGVSARRTRLPVPLMRALSLVVSPFSTPSRRMLQMGVLMATRPAMHPASEYVAPLRRLDIVPTYLRSVAKET
jgi:uncharacterized protein YbjT (DUF2867 family)